MQGKVQHKVMRRITKDNFKITKVEKILVAAFQYTVIIVCNSFKCMLCKK